MKFGVITFVLITCTMLQSKSQPVNDDWKDGNNTFKVDLKSIQSVVSSKRTLKQFETTLGHYTNKQFNSDTIVREGITKIITPYAIMNMKDLSVQVVRVTSNKEQVITGIQFYLVEDAARVEKLKNTLAQINTLGYKKDVAYTRINNIFARNSNAPVSANRRWYFYNATNKVFIQIFTVDYDYKYSVVIEK